ncbi:hypothetical protein Q7P37_011084 [Cladosporium fusiforme]
MHNTMLHLPTLALAIAQSGLVAAATSSSNSSNPLSAPFISISGHVHTMNSNGTSETIILDYGHSVEGIPSFEVLRSEGDTSIFEISYAESKAAFDDYMSDGPLPLAAAMDTYRVNRYNVSCPGVISNRLVQGAFRYQKLNLTSPGTLRLKNVGVHPTTDVTPIADLTGSFHTSDDALNRIWEAGARTVQLTEIPKHTIPDFYEVTPEGSVASSQAPQALGSAAAAQLLSYNMAFEVSPQVGGFGFTVLSDTLNSGVYISCDTVNRSISAHTGSTALNPMIESSTLHDNLTFSSTSWSSVYANVSLGAVSVTIDGVEVMSFSQTISFVGSFGFGASFGHRAIFRNLSVITPEGKSVYSHSLKDRSYLTDFFSGDNNADTVVDGSRRDRIAYTGDLDIAGGAALASTNGVEYILGSLDLLGSYQASPGFFIPTAKIQQPPLEKPLNVNHTGLIGYSFNFLNAVAATYMHTGDLDFAKRWASPVQDMLDWAHSQTLANGLFNVSQVSFSGDWNYYDPYQAGVVAKFNVIYAYALQECHQLLADAGVNATVYTQRLGDLRTAIDQNLWSDDLKAYYVSDDITDGFAQDTNAIAILAGVNIDPSHSTETIIASLDSLMNAHGPLAFSPQVISAGFQSYISPYASSYHLRAALASNASSSALKMLHRLWEPMANPDNANYTGTLWETLDQDGKPALGLITSLCHGWAAGPTAELSKYVLGATPTAPGWKEFQVAPQTLGLKFARGKVPTPQGVISVDWQFDSEDMFSLVVEAPEGSKGTLILPQELVIAANETVFTFNGVEQNGPFVMESGKTSIQQMRKKL